MEGITSLPPHLPSYFNNWEKRKRNAFLLESSESVGSNFQSETRIPNQVKLHSAVRNMDLIRFFEELFVARVKQFPYDQVESWNDEKLWKKVAKILFPHQQPNVVTHSLKSLVSWSIKMYQHDNTLNTIGDYDLKHKMLFVLGPLDPRLGPLAGENLEDRLGLTNLIWNYAQVETHQSSVHMENPIREYDANSFVAAELRLIDDIAA